MGKYVHGGRVLQETRDLLHETIIHRMTKKIKSKWDGTLFLLYRMHLLSIPSGTTQKDLC